MCSVAAFLPRLCLLLVCLGVSGCGGGGGGGDSGDSPRFSVSPDSLTFAATSSSSPTPPPQTATLNISGGAAYVAEFFGGAAIANATYQDTGPATRVYTVYPASPNALGAGTHTGTLRIVACADAYCNKHLSGSPRDIPVTYMIGDSIAASPGALNFTYVTSGSVPGAQNITVTTSPSSADWTASRTQSWIGLSRTSGTGSTTVAVTVDPSGLSAGLHTGTITFSLTGGGTQGVINVSLTIAEPAMVADDTTLSFDAVNGAPLAPQGVNLSTNDGLNVDWVATAGASWLVLSKTSGTTPDSFTVNVDPSIGALANGTYNSTITVAGDGVDPVTIDVSLVLRAPTLTANPSSLAFGGSDGTDLSGQSLQLSLDTGVNPYSWNVTSAPSWVSLSLSSGTASATPTGVNVAPNASGIRGGDYNGIITFTATINGTTATRNVPVSLRLDPHNLFVHDNGVALLSSPTHAKLTHTVTVRDNHNVSTNWNAASDQPWLAVTGSGTTGGSLELTANPMSLSTEAIHYANVTISSPDPTIENSGQEVIRVGFYVTTNTPMEPATVTVANPGKSTGLVADPIRPYVYVTHGGTNIDVYNIYTGALVHTVENAGSDVRTLTISSDGSRLYAVDVGNFSIVVVDLQAVPPSVLDTWTNPEWTNCSNCAHPYKITDLDYTRVNGRPLLVAPPARTIDALTGVELDNGTASIFASSSLSEVSGDGKVVFTVNTNTTGHTLQRFDLRYNAIDDVVSALPNGTAGKEGFARGLSSNYNGSLAYRACGYPDDIEVYNGNTLATISYITNGTNGGALLGQDGYVYCARYYSDVAAPGTPDLWAYDPSTGAAVPGRTYNIDGNVGDAGEYSARLFVLSGDGLRLITRSNYLTTLTSTTIPR